MADIRDTIRELESRRFRAMIEGDAGALDALLADTLVYTHSYGGADSKQTYLDGVRSKKWVYRKIERPKEDIQVHGDCVIVTGQVRIELIAEGTPKTLKSAYTDVWVKGPKGWQMTAWQSTPLP